MHAFSFPKKKANPLLDDLEQRRPNYGPWATYGPPSFFYAARVVIYKKT
jgi:hypothetical protein